MSIKELTFAQAKPFVLANLRAGHTPALLGEPGIGKTSWIQSLEKELKTKVFIIPVNQLADRADLTGVRMTQDKDNNWQQSAFPHQKINEAIKYSQDNTDECPILLLDEFNRASSDITSAILSFQTLREIGSVKFPDNLRLIVAGNDTGNITALDGASVSRFSLYKLTPDLETFLSVQTLNKFVHSALTKNPKNLMAPPIVETTEDTSDDDGISFAEHEYSTEESFVQLTRPRTISYMSQFLNEMGINGSGSDDERQVLGEMFTNVTVEDDQSILLAALVGHVGPTKMAYDTFEEIQTHFNNIISSPLQSGQSKLQNIRPEQTFINKLSKSNDVTSVEDLINNMNDLERVNALIWLTESMNVKEINNNDAVTAYMTNAPHKITEFNTNATKNLMSVLSDAQSMSKLSVRALIESSASLMAQWKPIISSILGKEM